MKRILAALVVTATLTFATPSFAQDKMAIVDVAIVMTKAKEFDSLKNGWTVKGKDLENEEAKLKKHIVPRRRRGRLPACNEIVCREHQDGEVVFVECENKRLKRALTETEDTLAPNRDLAWMFKQNLKRLCNLQPFSRRADKHRGSSASHGLTFQSDR